MPPFAFRQKKGAENTQHALSIWDLCLSNFKIHYTQWRKSGNMAQSQKQEPRSAVKSVMTFHLSKSFVVIGHGFLLVLEGV